MEAGKRIDGRYKVIKSIGSGGMAKVYLARDLILERDVAVKLMAYDFQNDEDSLRRFKREALSTTELHHPNIVNIYDVGETENPYIVMEYVEGSDLKEYIHDHHPIPYKKSLSIMNQILEAVENAHHNGIIHRDLKPQNILIDDEGKVKITDFGIAVALSQNSITQTNSLLGSVHYVSPEQARGSLVTKQSDIYSLGILLYELLTGEVPFDGESAVSIALKHFQNPLPSLRQIDYRLPQPLENVVLKATTKEANQRYESVYEMKQDLKTALSPERSGEEKFEPRDPNKEDTRVMDPIVPPSNQLNEQNTEQLPIKEEDKEVDQNEKEENKPKKKRRWIWVLLIFLLAASGIAFALFLSRPQEVMVPDLEGLIQQEAETEIEESNLVVGEVIEQSSEEIEEGFVIQTNPDTGATVREEAEVDLYISIGQEPFVLEDYEDEAFEEIRAELTELGFTVERDSASSDQIEEGNIIEQDVLVGEEMIPSETTITFIVSTGETEFPFRDLSGYSRASVDDYIEEHGLNMTIEEEPSDDVQEGQVVSQQPEPGSTLVSGSHVTVIFSTGSEEASLITFSHQVTIPYEPEDDEEEENGEEDDEENGDNDNTDDEETGATPNHVQIYIEDAENDMDDEPVHDFDMTEDTQLFLSFTVEEDEEASYQIVRDGEVIEEETVEQQ